jgi:hypothetical protein
MNYSVSVKPFAHQMKINLTDRVVVYFAAKMRNLLGCLYSSSE